MCINSRKSEIAKEYTTPLGALAFYIILNTYVFGREEHYNKYCGGIKLEIIF